MKKLEKIKGKRAITLVALVITIIILLILIGVGISAITTNGLLEKVEIAKNKSEDSEEKEKNILNQYGDEIVQRLYGSRDSIETKKCNLKISHDNIKKEQETKEVNTIISVEGIENIKKMIVSIDGKYFDSSNSESYRLPPTVRGEKNIYVLAIDDTMNIYKSDELKCNIEYPFNEDDLMIYWYGTEKDNEKEFGLWTQYSAWWKINRNISNIVFTGGHTSSGGVVAGFTTKEKIDLSMYKKMHVIFESTASAGRFSIVSSLGGQGSYGNEGGVISNFDLVNEPTEYEVDLTSLTGEYYIGTQLWGAEGDYKVLGWWLEK